MYRNKILTLFIIFTLPLITGCQTANLNNSNTKANQGSEPYFIYSVPEDSRTVTASSITVEFKYEDGCLFAFDGTKMMTPAFPKNDVRFDDKTQTLKILDTEYKMGEVVVAGGYAASNSRVKVNIFDNTLPSKCVKEYFAIFFGDYEKTVWNKM